MDGAIKATLALLHHIMLEYKYAPTVVIFLFYLLDLVVDLIKSHYYLAITTMIDNMMRLYDLVYTYAQQNFLVSKNVVIDLHFVSHKLKSQNSY